MTNNESNIFLSETLRKHKQWLDRLPGGKKADLQGADLQSEVLRGADLQGANLRGADLREADLQGANLRGADLRGADLRGADLREANLQGAVFRYADFLGADLQGAVFRYADLRGADLRGADLRETDLRGADLRGADLRETDLRGADLDFSCWPLWCGSLGVRVDARIARQLAYHFCRLDCDDPEYQAAREAIKDFANKFHRAEECGEIRTHDKMQDLMSELPKGEDNK